MVVMGLFGLGKIILLNIILMIDWLDLGDILIYGENLYWLKWIKFVYFCRKQFGFVFQDFNFLDMLMIGENIMLLLMLEKEVLFVMEEKLYGIVVKFGIEDLFNKWMFEVFGGQCQWVVIVRVVIYKLLFILVDELMGNFDFKVLKDVMEMMQSLNQNDYVMVLMVIYDLVVVSYCCCVIFIKDGELFNEIYCGENC